MMPGHGIVIILILGVVAIGGYILISKFKPNTVTPNADAQTPVATITTPTPGEASQANTLGYFSGTPAYTNQTGNSALSALATAYDNSISAATVVSNGNIKQYQNLATGAWVTVSPGQSDPYASNPMYNFVGYNQIQTVDIDTYTANQQAKAAVLSAPNSPIPANVAVLYKTYQAGGPLSVADYQTLKQFGLWP
jgi:hypothetical protein